MNKNKNLAFTLAEVLIVIGIIGVVAALTLPNLNHATGDKETVTRLMKTYSAINEAYDRASAIYGPASSWNTETCRGGNYNFTYCWLSRVSEFLKISKSCDESSQAEAAGISSSCDSLLLGDMESWPRKAYQLTDGATFSVADGNEACSSSITYSGSSLNDICFITFTIDVNGPSKGKNEKGKDIFFFEVSDSLGLIPHRNGSDVENETYNCLSNKDNDCSYWPFEYGNLDYLKADEEGNCNDSNIILDGVTNTSCH